MPSLINTTWMEHNGWEPRIIDTKKWWIQKSTNTWVQALYIGGQEVINATIVKRIQPRDRTQPIHNATKSAFVVTHLPVKQEFEDATAHLSVRDIIEKLKNESMSRNERNYLAVQLAQCGVLTTWGEKCQFTRAHEAMGFPSVRRALAISTKWGIDLGPYAKIVRKTLPTLLSNAHRVFPKRNAKDLPTKPPPYHQFVCDLIGPYAKSRFGQFKYALIFVDVGSSSPFHIATRDKSLKSLKEAAIYFLSTIKRELLEAKVFKPQVVRGQTLLSDGDKGLKHEDFWSVFRDAGFIDRRLSSPYSAWIVGRAERHIKTLKAMMASQAKAREAPEDLWPENMLNCGLKLDLSPNRSNPECEVPYVVRRQRNPPDSMLMVLKVPFYAVGARWRPKSQRGPLDTAGAPCRYLGYSRITGNHLVLSQTSRGSEKLYAAHVQFDDTSIPAIVAQGRIPPISDEEWTDAIAEDSSSPFNAQAYANVVHDEDSVSERKHQAQSMAREEKPPIYYHLSQAQRGPYKEFFVPKPGKNVPDCVETERQGLIDSGTIGPAIPRSQIGAHETIVRLKAIHTVKFDKDGKPFKGKSRYVYARPGQKRNVDYYKAATHQVRAAEVRLINAIQPPTPTNHMDAYHDLMQAFTIPELELSQLPKGMRVLVTMPEETTWRDENGLATVHSLLHWLYGMGGAGLAWEMHFFHWLEQKGWLQCIAAPCIWIRGDTRLDPEDVRGAVTHSADNIVIDYTKPRVDGRNKRLRITQPRPHTWDLDRLSIMSVYTDDCKQRGPEDHLRLMEKEMTEAFKGTKTVKNQLYIGTDHQRHEDGTYSMGNRLHIENIITRFNLTDLKLQQTPLQPGLNSKKLSVTEAAPLDPKRTTRYRSILGALGFPAIQTRPDASATQSMLGQRQYAPNEADEKALYHYLGYAYATRRKRIRYKLQEGAAKNKLYGSFDASVTNCEGAKSQIGYVIMMNGGPIAWQSRASPSVCLSTNSSESHAGADAIVEIIQLRNVLDFLGYGQDEPTPLETDSTGAMGYYEGEKVTKYAETRILYLREKTHDGTVALIKVDTDANIADIMTKSLYYPKHKKYLEMLVCAVFLADKEAGNAGTSPVANASCLVEYHEQPMETDKPVIANHDFRLDQDEVSGAQVVTGQPEVVPDDFKYLVISVKHWLRIRNSLLS